MRKEADRTSKTSTDVKRRYNEKTYTKIQFQAPKDLAADFKEACDRQNVSQASVLKDAMQDFVDKGREA